MVALLVMATAGRIVAEQRRPLTSFRPWNHPTPPLSVVVPTRMMLQKAGMLLHIPHCSLRIQHAPQAHRATHVHTSIVYT